ncbi:hypothetical protein EV567_1359 [Streptomyces sp. BK239]|nr:hypothetical protein EV567_1359 [Streptomyces sp. BK239]
MRRPGGPLCGWGPPGEVASSSGDETAHAELSSGSGKDAVRTAPRKGRGELRDQPQPAGSVKHRSSRGALGGDYSRSSAYEPMASAMSACAQNRWYVNEGAAPPAR